MRYAGTVLGRELTAMSKSRRTFALRVLPPLIMLFYVILVLSSSLRESGYEYGPELQMIGRQLFYSLTFILMGLMFLFTPSHCAPIISSEREKQTLELLTITPLRSHDIILGKIGSRVFSLVLIALSTAPIMFVCLMFGGVSPFDITVALGLVVSCILLCAGVSIPISVLSARSGRAIVRAFTILLLMGIASGVYAAVSVRTHVGSLYPSLYGLFDRGILEGILTFVLLWMNPFIVLSLLQTAPYFRPGLPAWAWFTGMAGSATFFILSVGLSSLLFKRAALWEKGSFFRLLFMGEKARRGPKKRTGGGGFRKPVVVGPNPVYWKECNESFFSRPSSRIGAAAAVIGTFFLLYLFTLAKWPTIWKWGPRGYYTHVRDIRVGHTVLIMAEIMLVLMSIISVASGSMIKERVKKTAEILLTTPLSNGSIWCGKFLSVLRLNLLFLLLPFIHIGLCIFHGIYELWTLVVTFITVSALALFFAALGIRFSLTNSRRRAASSKTLGVGFLLFIGFPILAGLLAMAIQSPYPRSSDSMEIITSLSPLLWLIFPLADAASGEFFSFGIGYFWFTMLYLLGGAAIMRRSASSLRERLLDERLIKART